MNIIDLHTHTISSGHAYSTFEENVRGAKRSQIKYLGTSDHAVSMPGGPHEFHFVNMSVLPKVIEDINILIGIEANIMDYNGTIDVADDIKERMDYIIASLHPPVITPGNIEENTRSIIEAMKNPDVTIIGHPDDGRYPVDYNQIVQAAKKTNTLLEINNASLNPSGYREGTVENSRTILNLCKEHGVSVIFGSDAHVSYSIGDFTRCVALANEVEFPESLIVNNDFNKLKKYLNSNI
ncbi:MAG: phosphatase [Clostridiales bacterium]|nr:phosphatase [Clostridiales bacterium]